MVKRMKKKEILILLLCLLVGFALRFYTFDQKSLWMDEIYTFNDSRDDLKGQLKFYKENPTFLHPPLFFILTHQFYPFTKPERDLRIIPLIFGTLSIPMIYLLARQFSPSIALPCALSLTFMTYHISLSQDGRSYSLIMFLGMVGLYFFMKQLQRSKKIYLFLVASCFSLLFYTSYSSIPFVAFSQILWFYRKREDNKKPTISSFLHLNGTLLIFCIPWIIFVAVNYKGQALMDPFHIEAPDSFWTIIFGIFHDWTPHAPLLVAAIVLLILFPIFSKFWKNTLVLLAVFLISMAGLYLFCILFQMTHFITSRYFINFLPIFFISIYLSINAIEDRFETLKRFIRLKHLFIILLIASNLLILPLYYRSEKQDFRGLANYLKREIRDGDKIIVGTIAYSPGILHYLGVYPKGRNYIHSFRKVSEKEMEYRYLFSNQNKKIIISYSETFWAQYAAEGNRLWIVVDNLTAKEIKKNTPSVLKGYFDGSVANFERFPVDASLYLFLWDPKSPEEKGIDMTIK
jgi:hypothetical protein